MSILVVEDDKITGKVLKLNLKKHGYDVIWVENGKEALDTLHSTLGIELIIADIMMPELSGLELLREIKNSPELSKIPVIMSTSRQDSDSVKEAIQNGCLFYLIKPINAGVLIEKVKEALGHNASILQDKEKIMLRTNMDERAYRTISIEYYNHIKELIETISENLDNEKKDIQVDIRKIEAGANVLGADHIAKRIKQMGGVPDQGKRVLSAREQNIFLRDLKEFCNVFEKEFQSYLQIGIGGIDSKAS